MQNIYFIIKFLRYKLFAKHRKGFGIHSPFLYKLVANVIYNDLQYYATDDIWNFREDLKNSKLEIQVTDLGAGSKVMKSKTRKVSDIVKYSAVETKYGELLFRLINNFQPKTILELGTSVGISTLYLALPNSNALVHTFEACPETSKIARQNFDLFGLSNIEQHIGNIDVLLHEFLKNSEKPDFVYFDANHTEEATLHYFNLCREFAHEKTVFVFDDIHWSEGMGNAWKKIKSDSSVTLTIDLFFTGIIFFDKNLSKEDFVVKF